MNNIDTQSKGPLVTIGRAMEGTIYNILCLYPTPNISAHCLTTSVTQSPGMTNVQKMKILTARPQKAWSDVQCHRLRGGSDSNDPPS